MPIYEYRCENGHLFEVMQRITDDPVTACQECGAAVQRVFHPVAVHFKGSGFYNTDYGTARRKREQDASAKADKGDGAKTGDGTKTTSDSSSSSSSSGGSGGSGSPAPPGPRTDPGQCAVVPRCDAPPDRLSRSGPWT
jgi:putative FmdB family regulatory protein